MPDESGNRRAPRADDPLEERKKNENARRSIFTLKKKLSSCVFLRIAFARGHPRLTRDARLLSTQHPLRDLAVTPAVPRGAPQRRRDASSAERARRLQDGFFFRRALRRRAGDETVPEAFPEAPRHASASRARHARHARSSRHATTFLESRNVFQSEPRKVPLCGSPREPTKTTRFSARRASTRTSPSPDASTRRRAAPRTRVGPLPW